MADKKMTRREALTNAINWIADGAGEDQEMLDTIEVLSKMVASLDKASSKPKGKTTARIQNEKYLTVMLEKMKNRKNHEPVTPKWVAENVSGVRSTQRAVHVAKIGLELGEIKEIRSKKSVYYALIDWEPPVEDE